MHTHLLKLEYQRYYNLSLIASNLKCCQTSETAIEILHSLQSPPSQAGLSSHHDGDGNSSVIQLQTTGMSISQNSDCSSVRSLVCIERQNHLEWSDSVKKKLKE